MATKLVLVKKYLIYSDYIPVVFSELLGSTPTDKLPFSEVDDTYFYPWPRSIDYDFFLFIIFGITKMLCTTKNAFRVCPTRNVIDHKRHCFFFYTFNVEPQTKGNHEDCFDRI